MLHKSQITVFQFWGDPHFHLRMSSSPPLNAFLSGDLEVTEIKCSICSWQAVANEPIML